MTRGAETWVGLGLLALALGLRLAAALHGSFFLDDFHSLFHARAASWSSFFEGLEADNHPPLFLLVLHALRSVLGEGEFVLRTPNILFGTWAVWILWRLGRRLPNLEARALAAALFACSSLQIDLSSNLRMYVLLGLSVLGVLDALLDLLDPLPGEGQGTTEGRARWRLGAWSAVALLTHYHALHAAGVLGLALGTLLLMRVVEWRRVRLALAPLLIACLLVAPWYVLGFSKQLEHGLPPGGAHVSLRILAESLVHLVYLRLDLLGRLRTPALVLGCVTVMLAVLGTGILVRRARRSGRGWALFGTVAALAFVLPAWTALVARLQPRAGFEWRYLVAAIGPFTLLVGAAAVPGAFRVVRRVLLGLCLVAAFALDLANIADPGREDYRGASAYVLDELEPGDGVLAMEWQPALFPHGGGWAYYRSRLAKGGQGNFVNLEHRADFTLVDRAAVRLLPRVFCILRSIPDSVPALADLRAIFPSEEKLRFGEGVWVLVFSCAP